MKSVCRALLVLNVLYCLLAAAQEGVPGWHMFESVERLDHTLRDREGAEIDVHAYLPRGAHLVDRAELRAVVTWICEHERTHAPFVYEENALRVTLDGDCRIHAPR